MIRHTVRVHPSADELPRENQLAWHIAEFATGTPPLDEDAVAMACCRLVDNAAVALAAINRAPVAAARAQALAHPRAGGARLFGLEAVRVHAQWAAWANAVAVRELDFHDTFLAQEMGHPGDNIPPLLAVAQQCGVGGEALLRGILVAYEVHVNLMKSIDLHSFKKDHLAHLAPGAVAGIGAMLGLSTEVVYQAVNQAVHLTFSTRQSRKGEISSWKAFVPGFSGKIAVEAVDRAMRGEASPSPIYEGEDSVIAWMLGGPEVEYEVALPARGEAPTAILETYTKAHSAEYQSQAIIDLAFELREGLDLSEVESVTLRTSNHTHVVIGSGANDPQKSDPDASRETLDHSILYILAVALEDGEWHHERSYSYERAHRASTVALWRKVRTEEDEEWNRRYHDPDPSRRAFGGRVEIRLRDGRVVAGEKHVADAHPNGRAPWTWPDYEGKLRGLAEDVLSLQEIARFLELARRARSLDPAGVLALMPVMPEGRVVPDSPTGDGIFDHP